MVRSDHFHLCKAVQREVGHLGMRRRYPENADFALRVRILPWHTLQLLRFVDCLVSWRRSSVSKPERLFITSNERMSRADRCTTVCPADHSALRLASHRQRGIAARTFVMETSTARHHRKRSWRVRSERSALRSSQLYYLKPLTSIRKS
jgi:hypothetical protein